jgi:RNA 3'-terminal phosphate cyclase (ATP)
MTFLTLDGSHGEGGGQVLRTALSLSATTGRAFRLINVRAGRPNPGLRPQHLSAVRAAAAICGAVVGGDQLGSAELTFAPSRPPGAGSYLFDVAEIAERGSAGSVTLLLQTLLVPLAFADGVSTVVLRGGTHVEWSPPFDHVVDSYLPMLRRMGLHVDADLTRWGWYPVGQGEIVCRIGATAPAEGAHIKNVELLAREPLRRVTGRAIAASLPAHIAQRMADRARTSLGDLGVPVRIEPQRVTAACPGAGIFLVAEYGDLSVAFSAYGRLGKPAEAVADDAVAALRDHHASKATVELHLADQLLLPAALASGVSTFTTPRPTGHLTTNAWAIGQFGTADISIEEGTPCCVRVEPHDWRPGAPATST